MYGIVKVGQLKWYNHSMYSIKIDNKITAVVILTGIIAAVLFLGQAMPKRNTVLPTDYVNFTIPMI